MMPYSLDTIMWQIEFSYIRKEAKELHTKAKALLEEACSRTQVLIHSPDCSNIKKTRFQVISNDHELLTSNY
jgi:hypothetical protein